MIDKDKLDEGDPNYLYILEIGEYTPLNLNFEIFLDRYIQSNGEAFWVWQYYTAENYYRTR
ncbi:SMI1 / KNR4 family protein [Bacillus sp. FW1]|nr:SMI1 / KNR4 family protein [Bacillus sp. FW1]